MKYLFCIINSIFKILLKNWNFGETLKFYPKIEILVKNWNFGQRLKFFSKMEILVKIRNSTQKWKFSSKFEILPKNRNFAQKSKFFSKFFEIYLTSLTVSSKFIDACAAWIALAPNDDEPTQSKFYIFWYNSNYINYILPILLTTESKLSFVIKVTGSICV